ncbi:MAG: hypothetical protein RBT60_07420 [Candidatus Krumholzibacteria bacterium]|jgi:hypothetical protein|nr:hypothetical protein [Candidatus Krumholzibacteria bacterium]MDY0109751.1 hypothetical protein [Candidatus Krumholzibacteria bacterium]
MLDVSRLNDHSRLFAQQLFREFPDWLAFARFDPYEDFEKEALLVEVPRPVGDGRHGLFITTSEWEIAVGFGENFHTRFGVSGRDDTEDFRRCALDFIRDFVAERLVLVTAHEGDQWLGAWIEKPDEQKLSPAEIGPGESLRIRSWRGTFDRELP